MTCKYLYGRFLALKSSMVEWLFPLFGLSLLIFANSIAILMVSDIRIVALDHNTVIHNITKFVVNTSFGYGYGNTSEFCYGQICEIPCIFKGFQIIQFYNSTNLEYSTKKVCETGLISCNTDGKHSICEFRNLIFKSRSSGVIYSPYTFELNTTVISCGRSDDINSKFVVKSIIGKQNEKMRRVFGVNLLIYNSVNMHILWHYLLESFFPTLHSWYFHFGANKKINIITMSDLRQFNDNINFRKIWKLISQEPIGMAWTDVVYDCVCIGVWRIGGVEYDKNKCWDAKYYFRQYRMDELRNYIYEYYKVRPVNNSSPVIWVARRMKGNRQILNFDDMYRNLTHYFPKATFYVPNFYDLSFEKLIPMISKVDLFISIHGSDLVNSVFMRKGSSIFELHLYLFHTRVCYKELANDIDVNYYIWYPKKNPYKTNLRWSNECLSGPCVGLNLCYYSAREQNLTVDIGAVVKTVGKSLISSGFDINLANLPGPGDIKGPGDDLS